MTNGVPSMFRSKPPQPSWLIVGDAGSRRTKLFLNALAFREQTNVKLTNPLEVIASPNTCIDLQPSNSILRIESLGEEIQWRQALLRLGANAAEAEGSPVASESEMEEERSIGNYAHPFWSRQMYLGMTEFYRRTFAGFEPTNRVLFHRPQDVLLMFDKWTCQLELEFHGLPTPERLLQPCDYREVRDTVRHAGRCMLKAAHGSGGSGCVAMFSNGTQVCGITPLRYDQNRPDWIYCSTSLQTISDEVLLGRLIDRLCMENALVERWMPKAKFQGKNFDLRVVVIGGQVSHIVARVSSGPFTNLNLLNQRINLTTLVESTSTTVRGGIDQAISVCQQAATAFPDSISIGFDVLIDPRGQPYLLEANPFGNLLPGILSSDGLDTYTCEVDAALRSWTSRREMVSCNHD